MKVSLEKDYRKIYTLDDLDRAKLVISFEKDDEDTPSGWAAYAVNELGDRCGYCREIIRATAHTAKNRRVWDAYGDGSQDMDVWIEGLARTDHGYLEFGAYLSDIWASGQTPYAHHIFYSFFKEQ